MEDMLIVLNIMALSVVLGFLVAYPEKTQSNIDPDQQDKKTAKTKKCPCCDAEVNADAYKCEKCGTTLIIYKQK